MFGFVMILVLLSSVCCLVIWCTWQCDIHFMVCDCQCGISNVGICIGMVYIYVVSVFLLTSCWVSGYFVYTAMWHSRYGVWLSRVLYPVFVSGLVQYMIV